MIKYVYDSLCRMYPASLMSFTPLSAGGQCLVLGKPIKMMEMLIGCWGAELAMRKLKVTSAYPQMRISETARYMVLLKFWYPLCPNLHNS